MVFTPVEVDILECLASFWNVSDICQEIGGTETKIRSYIVRLKKKLGFSPLPDEDRSTEYRRICEIAHQLFQKIQLYTLQGVDQPEEDQPQATWGSKGPGGPLAGA